METFWFLFLSLYHKQANPTKRAQVKQCKSTWFLPPTTDTSVILTMHINLKVSYIHMLFNWINKCETLEILDKFNVNHRLDIALFLTLFGSSSKTPHSCIQRVTYIKTSYYSFGLQVLGATHICG